MPHGRRNSSRKGGSSNSGGERGASRLSRSGKESTATITAASGSSGVGASAIVGTAKTQDKGKDRQQDLGVRVEDDVVEDKKDSFSSSFAAAAAAAATATEDSKSTQKIIPEDRRIPDWKRVVNHGNVGEFCEEVANSMEVLSAALRKSVKDLDKIQSNNNGVKKDEE